MDKKFFSGNLERFRSEIQLLTKNQGEKAVKFQHSHGISKTRKPVQSRKERRKEDRIEKKSRRNAYSRRIPIPTREEKEKAKKEAMLQEKMEQKKKKLKEKKKKQKKKNAKKRKETEDAEEEERRFKTIYDDKEIKDLEKKLGLSKRKKKDTLPQSFKNDGLDYILDVVDPEKLQMMTQLNQLEGDSNDEDEFDQIGEGSESDDADDADLADFYEEEEEEDNARENVKDIEKPSVNTPLENKSNSKTKTKDGTDVASGKSGKESGNKESGPSEKKEKWEELADRIKEITEKKMKEKAEKKKDKKVRFVEDENEEITNSESDDDFDGEMEEFSDEDSEDHCETGDADEVEGTEDVNEDSSIENMEDDTVDDEGLFEKDQELMEGKDTDLTDVTEDIYGRLRDSEGRIVKDNKPAGGEGAYVPPAKRMKLAGGDDEKRKLKMEQLQKQLKGLVNRASENNMQPISSQVEELYLSNSRADVTETLLEIVSSACVTPVLTPDRLSMELMMLVAILHGNVGSEVGAAFLQEFARQFDHLLREENYGAGKQIDNVIVLLAHLYNFKVMHSLLIFSVIRKLAESFHERDVELILLMLRHVGFTLRKDDPAELKDLIVQIQSKASGPEGSSLADQSRVRFMLEVILAIRNNNMRKIPNYDPDHLEHLRKMIRNYMRGGHFGDNQLHISLEDLLNAEQHGKWWLVGSSWEGKDTKNTEQDGTKNSSVVGGLEVSSKLQALARKQRMNTELRRNIFFIIMTSEDFLDAFEKLLRLGLKSNQQQEVVIVILSCCMQEKNYNPFYAVLSQKFCEYHRTYQMGFQFSLWDQFKELGSLSDRRRSHLAKLLVHLFTTRALSLSILKVVSFGTLDKSMVRLLKQIMTEILLDHPEAIVKDCFTRIAQLDKLKPLHEGLRLFLRHFLTRWKKGEPKNPLLLERIELVDTVLSRGKGHVLL